MSSLKNAPFLQSQGLSVCVGGDGQPGVAGAAWGLCLDCPVPVLSPSTSWEPGSGWKDLHLTAG